jgi:hypothetical protein
MYFSAKEDTDDPICFKKGTFFWYRGDVNMVVGVTWTTTRRFMDAVLCVDASNVQDVPMDGVMEEKVGTKTLLFRTQIITTFGRASLLDAVQLDQTNYTISNRFFAFPLKREERFHSTKGEGSSVFSWTPIYRERYSTEKEYKAALTCFRTGSLDITNITLPTSNTGGDDEGSTSSAEIQEGSSMLECSLVCSAHLNSQMEFSHTESICNSTTTVPLNGNAGDDGDSTSTEDDEENAYQGQPLPQVVYQQHILLDVEEQPIMQVMEQQPVMQVVEQQPAIQVAEQQPAIQVAEQQPVMQVAEQQPVMQVVEQQPVMQVAEQKPAIQVAEQQPVMQVTEQQQVVTSVSVIERKRVGDVNRPTPQKRLCVIALVMLDVEWLLQHPETHKFFGIRGFVTI